MSKQTTQSDDNDQGSQFHIDEDGEFFITIAGGATVYENKQSAVAEVSEKVDQHDDAFVAKTEISGSGEDMSIELNQVPWQEIIGAMNDG
jgi:hypothetical protein